MPIGSRLVQANVNPRLLLAIGACFIFPLFIIASFMESFAAFGVLYVFGWAINQGMVYLVPVHHSWLWFPKNGGLVSGIVLGGYGAGALIFDNVLTHLVNPNNESADKDTGFYSKDVDDRFMMTWRIVIACWFVLAVIGIATTFPGPVPKSETKRRNI